MVVSGGVYFFNHPVSGSGNSIEENANEQAPTWHSTHIALRPFYSIHSFLVCLFLSDMELFICIGYFCLERPFLAFFLMIGQWARLLIPQVTWQQVAAW
jgi:hypothetical protein